MRTYSHTSKSDLEEVADAIRRLNHRQLADFNSWLHVMGLMRTHWPIEWYIGFLAKLKGAEPCAVWFRFFYHTTALNKHAREQTLVHLLHGTDQDDPQSAGGFSRDEFETVVDILDGYGAFDVAPSSEAA